MHPLDSIAKACEKVIKLNEDSISINDKKTKGNYPFQHRGESNTQALVRTTAKLFHDNKYSCVHELTVHLKSLGAVPQEDGKKSVLYHRFVGNRFHIYFLSSGCLYHYRNALIAFFTDVFIPQNSVHSCILNALQIQDMHVTTRAFGIVGKLVTGPWMRLLGVETNILGMNKHFQEALDNITTWRHDASSLIQPEAPCAFSSVEVKRDTVFRSLAEPTDFNSETISLLKALCKACVEVMERQLQSQLPGGEFWSPSAQLLRGRIVFKHKHQRRALLCHCRSGDIPCQKCDHWPHRGQNLVSKEYNRPVAKQIQWRREVPQDIISNDRCPVNQTSR